MQFNKFNGLISYDQRNNFQKIQYWGLTEKIKTDGGTWGLTKKGYAFLAGEIPVYKSVWTYRNQTQRFDGPEMYIDQFDPEQYRKHDDYVADEVSRYIDDSGQIQMF